MNRGAVLFFSGQQAEEIAAETQRAQRRLETTDGHRCTPIGKPQKLQSTDFTDALTFLFPTAKKFTPPFRVLVPRSFRIEGSTVEGPRPPR